MFDETIIFNTGCHYGPEGQVIQVTPWDANAGVYVMNDISRGICYVYQFTFEINSAKALEFAVMKRYLANGPEYSVDDYSRLSSIRDAAPGPNDDGLPAKPEKTPMYFIC